MDQARPSRVLAALIVTSREGGTIIGGVSFGWCEATHLAGDENDSMPRIEVLFALGTVALIVYAMIAAIGSGTQRRARSAIASARWQAAHYAADHTTRVVVRRVAPATGVVVDEHIVAIVADDDPDYHAKFLEAMAEARQRVALFESEEP